MILSSNCVAGDHRSLFLYVCRFASIPAWRSCRPLGRFFVGSANENSDLRCRHGEAPKDGSDRVLWEPQSAKREKLLWTSAKRAKNHNNCKLATPRAVRFCRMTNRGCRLCVRAHTSLGNGVADPACARASDSPLRGYSRQ